VGDVGLVRVLRWEGIDILEGAGVAACDGEDALMEDSNGRTYMMVLILAGVAAPVSAECTCRNRGTEAPMCKIAYIYTTTGKQFGAPKYLLGAGLPIMSK
jgi:hypothetical protein